MKTQIGKLPVLTLIFTLFLLSFIYNAQGEEFKKYVERKFDVDKDATLMIKNKFGSVHCEVWANPSVSVKVEITVSASNQEKANKVFDKISVDLSGDRSKVSGITEIGTMSFTNTEFSIDYYIMMPNSLNIDLSNSFGEIFLEETSGTARIMLEYGELKVKSLNGTGTDITMKFSEGSVDYLKDGKLFIEYGEFDSESANSLDIHSRFSELNIDKMESLVLDSQYDDISIGSTGKFNAVTRFSDLEIDRLNGDFTIDSQYGEVSVGYIYPEFSTGRVDAAFSGVSLTFDSKASFNVDAVMKFCELDYPSANSSISHQEEGYTTNVYKGVIGSNRSATASLVINSKNGDVSVSY